MPTLSVVLVGFESFHFGLVLLTIWVTQQVTVKILVFWQESFVTKKNNKTGTVKGDTHFLRKTKEKKTNVACEWYENINHKILINNKINSFVLKLNKKCDFCRVFLCVF